MTWQNASVLPGLTSTSNMCKVLERSAFLNNVTQRDVSRLIVNVTESRSAPFSVDSLRLVLRTDSFWSRSAWLSVKKWHFLLQLLCSHQVQAQQVQPHPLHPPKKTHFIWKASQKGPARNTENNPVMCAQNNHFAFIQRQFFVFDR